MTAQAQSADRIPVTEIVEPRATESWTHTRSGEPRGYIDPQQLRELWIHTGTACNLSCPFCLEGSHPGDGRIPGMKLDDVRGYLHEAMDLGVEQFSFTGGEPFVIRDFVNILDYASQHRPCFVLTNATDPLLKRRHQVEPLLHNAYPIHFRVSLDFPDEARHDHDRGAGSFNKALEGIRWLVDQGFEVSIARQIDDNEDPEAVEDAFRAIFRDWGIPDTLAFTAFPDLGTPGTDDGSPEITESCMEKYPTEQSRSHFMCTYTRMLVKKDDEVRIFACTLVDDDPQYDLGTSLKESMEERIMLRHHRCFACYRFGASCSAPS
ncbi:radical SAM family protein [Tamilnaduibacter salinus]|uniref:Radical SAM family protein n=1 Tax=Tamilnaduibacter salinus TaxID=1484056 RepID=A0A2A2HZD6_9GAMM|nr:radical SAM protein [Tamilnaduibacter salinus]PAV24717.1 radical SAM protein [Tamilnaduibacter salinus]PVY77383.1 radical SAM family protein [Tamilnaduibacter salinus]